MQTQTSFYVSSFLVRLHDILFKQYSVHFNIFLFLFLQTQVQRMREYPFSSFSLSLLCPVRVCIFSVPF